MASKYVRGSVYDDDEYVKAQKNYDALVGQKPELSEEHNAKLTLANDQLDKYNSMKFNYDLNGDALYQQYKNQHVQQGKQAAMDTMGQAATLTGGYGNSYAATAGNQAYQGYLTRLNDIVPELYQLAYSKYADEKAGVLDMYGIYSNQADDIYARHRDDVADWKDNVALAGNEMDRRYGMWSDNETARFNQYISDQEQENWQKNYDYQVNRDEIEDQRYADETVRSRAADMALAAIQAGITPSNELLKAAGYDATTAKNLATHNANQSVGINPPSVDDDIKNKADAFNNDFELNFYLNDLVASNTISKEQAKSLYAQYKKDNIKKFKYGNETHSYYLVDDGGANFLWWNDSNSLDDDAKVMAEDGNVYTMKQIEKEFGRDYALKLQKKMGIV